MMGPDHGLEGSPSSYWMETTSSTSYPALPPDVHVDVAVLGGGIAGITAAALLKQQGLKVAVVEADRIASRISGHTTAHISAGSTSNYYRGIAGKFGMDEARLCARSATESIDKIEELVRTHEIDCDLSRADEFLYGATGGARDGLREEAALEARLGLPVSFQDDAPLPFPTFGALRYREQAEFHPRKYLLALAATVPGDGSHICEMTRAHSIDEGRPCEVRTDKGVLTANDVIVATGSPITILGLLHARMTVRRSYVLGIRTEDHLPEHAMFYSDEEPCHYIREAEPGLLLVGGEDHVTGQVTDTRQRYATLSKYCGSHFRVRSVEMSWSTQDHYPDDGLPFIGLLPGSRHQYVATGFKGTGMTYGTLSGMVLSDLIARGSSPYATLYSPGRLGLRASGASLLTRNLHVAGLFTGARLHMPPSLDRLQRGEAGLVTMEGKKLAAFRDPSGDVHAVSPACAHMGCYVRWNNAERSWDCPCHGSRYDADGRAISSPTAYDLPRLDGRMDKKR